MKIIDLQPSQLFINQGKLEFLSKKLESEGIESLQPIPIKHFSGIEKPVITDGHTRAYLLLQHGISEIEVEAEDWEMDWTIYRLCVFWAHQRDIQSVADLTVLHEYEYLRKWIRACHQAEKELDTLFPNRSYEEVIDYQQYPQLSYVNMAQTQTEF